MTIRNQTLKMEKSSQSKSRQYVEDADVPTNTRLRFMTKASGKVRLLVISVIIGVIAGIAAAVLKWLVEYVVSLVDGFRFSSGPDWSMLWIPIVGIVLTGIYQRYILRDHISHGVDRLVNDLETHRYLLSFKLIYAPIIASSLTLGFGGSAGSEGPIAYSGAAIGSNVGRICGVSPRTLYILIGCGASAGIAGIFKAPVGGALFALEVLGMTLTTVSIIALLTSSITATLVAYILSDYTSDFNWIHNVPFDPGILPWVLLLGLSCGIYSVYYSYIMGKMRKFYDTIENPWLKNIISGAVLAITIFIFPSLFSEGYDIIGMVINMYWAKPFGNSLLSGIDMGDMSLIVVLGGVLLLKCFACSAANSGGGVAGDFAPTLFAGCIAGLLFALLINRFFGQNLPSQVFAYIGMAGVMAGVIRAPFMALFLTAEMCNGFDYIMPLVAVTVISYGVARLFGKHEFYGALIRFEQHIRDRDISKF